MRIFLWSVLCALVLSSNGAWATAPRAPDEDVDEALTRLVSGPKRGAESLDAYVLLREIWARWEDARPLVVEQALLVAAESHRLTAPERAYAKALSGYARLRRGDTAAAGRIFRELGFVDDWMVVGPFDNEGKAGFDEIFAPEDEAGRALVPGRAYTGKERPVRYRALPTVSPYGWVNLGNSLRPSSRVCAFLSTSVEGRAKPEVLSLWLGASGAHAVFWNGQEVLRDASYRGIDLDRRAQLVRLLPGWNSLVIKLCTAESVPMMSVRFGDASGAPLRVTTRSDVEATTLAEAQRQAGPLPSFARPLRGPLDLALALLDKKTFRAAELEAGARYLALTGGDDPALHQARELAERAVAAEKSVPRWILAAALAEDRNQARSHLEKARALEVEPGSREDVELSLGEADLARTGPSPINAFPLYDRVLGFDPENTRALRGRVDLLNHAGLYRTALAALERALEARPQSVILLNMVASQLVRVGESEGARAVEDRYSAQRFDDLSYWKGRVELGLSRRASNSVEHYLARMREVEPDSLWNRLVTAEAHRQLGQLDRSYFDLKEARELAPEDTAVLMQLADYQGRDGKRDEQLASLQEVLRLRPQNVEVREYVDHMAPPEAPPDEKYALASDEFLRLRHAPFGGFARRTLRDLTVTTVYESGLSRQFRQVVFQPLTDAAAALSRQYAFQYQADSQQVQLKGAWVYRADGRTDEAIESGEGAADDPSISMYTSARTFYVQFPRLEPGDVVELRYRIDDVTNRNEFADYYGDVVYLENDEPVQNAEYILIAPKSRKLHFDVQGLELETSEKTEGDRSVHRFFAKKLNAVVPEPAMPPWSEVLGFVHVSTYPTWNALGRWYWGLVKDQLDLDGETRRLARQITAGKTSTEDKVKAVYGWVVKNTRYVALEFGIYGFKPRRCVQTVARGWGDCKDKATVIVTLLRELGIPANLVIVRTGMRGDFSSQLASLAPFDHAIAYVPELDLYLDGTAEYTGMHELPAMDQRALGLIVKDGAAELVRLPTIAPDKNVVARTLKAVLQKNGRAQLEFAYQTTGNAAASYRNRYESKGTLKERLSEDMAAELPGFEINGDSIRTSDLSDIESPVEMSFLGVAPRFARLEGDLLNLGVTINSRLTADYASLSSRQHDVRIVGFSNRKQTVELTIPDGFSVQSAPTSVSKDTPFGRYRVDYKKEGNKITVESELFLKVDRVNPQDYVAFRRFSAEVDRAFEAPLVLEPTKRSSR